MIKRLAAIIGILTVIGSGSVALHAQVEDSAETPTIRVTTTDETLTLRVGDVFEIAADSGAEGATYSWILTQDRSFIEATRERVFRYRFVQDKPYVLRADVYFPTTGERRQRSFTIDVLLTDTDTPPNVIYPAGTGAALAGTTPAPDTNGRVVLGAAEQVMQLTPIRTDLSPIAVDLDADRDTDGDGNPANDIDNAGTYFHSFGRPLWIWFARPLTQSELIITAIQAGTSPMVQRITVMHEDVARQQGVLTSPVEITTTQIDDTTFAFIPTLIRSVAGDSPLLYEWDLGDGNRSLETEPVHTYATSGTFTVRLHVRDLGTGNTIGRTETSVSPVVSVPPVPEEPDPIQPPVVEEPDPAPPKEPVQPMDIPWSRILFYGGIFGISLLVGIIIIWLLSFVRSSRRLEQTLESMEQAIVPPKDQTPAPLTIKSKPQTPPASTQQKIIDAEINAASPKNTTPPVTDAATPDWLKKGLSPVAASTTPAKNPPTPTAPKAAPATPAAPSPSKPASSEPTPAVDASKLPYWLQPNPPTTPAPSSTAATPTTPVAKPVTPPVPPTAAPITPPAKPTSTPVTPPAPSPVKPAPVIPPTPTTPQTPTPTRTTVPLPEPKKITPQTVPTPASVPPTPTAIGTPPSASITTPSVAIPAKPATPMHVTPASAPTPLTPKPIPTPATPSPIAQIAPTPLKPTPTQPIVTTPPSITRVPTPVTPPQAPRPALAPITSPTALPTPKPITPVPPVTTIAPIADTDDDRPIAIIRAESIDSGPKN